MESPTGRIQPKILRLGNFKLVGTPNIFNKVTPLAADNKNQIDVIPPKLISCIQQNVRFSLF